MSLVARHLEAHGLPTVIMGCAPDIVEHCGVPRLLASDFPLGNSAGQPFDETSQRETLAQALELFETATSPRTTRISPQRWAESDDWKLDFMNIELLSDEQIGRRRAAFEDQKRVAAGLKPSRP